MALKLHLEIILYLKTGGFMSKYLILILTLFCIWQTAISIDIGKEYNQSAALTDDLFSAFINPAALSFGNSGGIGWIQLWDENEFQKNYWLVANLSGLSYIYERDNNTNTHTLANGFEIFGPYKLPNLYGGTAYKWTNNKFEEGNFKSGILYRPLPFSSIGFVWNNPYKAAPNYQLALGVRPFAFVIPHLQHRLELSADYLYKKDVDGDYKLYKPQMNLNTEIINGISLGAGYNLESETYNLNFSVSAGKLQLGSFLNTKKDRSNLSYVFASDKSFLPFAGYGPKQWYALPIGSDVVTYRTPRASIGPFKIYDSKVTSVESIISDIQKAQNDPSVAGIVFVNKNFTASMALRQELISSLKSFKETKRPIVFYYDNISNSDYVFAASTADRIYLNPLGTIDLKGLAVTSPYLKDALEKLGIEVINFRSHAYKTAGNILSESEMTAEERSEYELLLTDIYQQMCDMISSGRSNKLKNSITETIDNGPYYIAADALEAGLIDGLVYESEFNELLKNEFTYNKTIKELPEYQSYSWAKPTMNKVAIIYAQGNIVMGNGPVGKKIAHNTTVDMIRRARNDKEIKGIILRVDSGGGSAQASDIIYKELEIAKDKNKKAIVVSMSGVAASGGYYISGCADYIYANPATLTGSIGVLGIAINAEDMFNKLFINWSTVKKGKNSDLGNFSRKLTEAEKDMMKRLIAKSYTDFLIKMSKSRKMEVNELDKIAQGKVWTGNQAKSNGLIDETGGLFEAKEKIKEVANINGEIELVDMAKSTNRIEFSLPLSFSKVLLNQNKSLTYIEHYIQIYEQWLDYNTDNILYLSNYNLSGLSKN